MKLARTKWLAYGTLLAAVLGLAAMQSWPVEDLVPWRTDLTADLDPPAERPTLIYVGADWCPPCRYMERNVFSHAATADAIVAAATPVKLDLSNPPPSPAHDLARSLGAHAMPTFILLGPDGGELGRISGGRDREELLDWLKTLAPVGPPG